MAFDCRSLPVASLLLDDQDLPEDDHVDDTGTFDLFAIQKNAPEKELYTYIGEENLQTTYNANEA